MVPPAWLGLKRVLGVLATADVAEGKNTTAHVREVDGAGTASIAIGLVCANATVDAAEELLPEIVGEVAPIEALKIGETTGDVVGIVDEAGSDKVDIKMADKPMWGAPSFISTEGTVGRKHL